MPTLKVATRFERITAIGEALSAGHGSAARLMAAFSDDSSFGDLRNGWIQQPGGYGMMVQSHMVPHLLIENVIDGHSAQSLLEEARAFAGSRTAITEEYMPLAGATVAEAITLGHDVDIIPWVDVPDGSPKTSFGPDRPHHEPAFSAPIHHPFPAVANSAVRIRSSERQVLFSSRKDAEGAMEASATERADRDVRMQDIVRCITALSVRPVAWLGNWIQFGNRIANILCGSGYGWYGTLFESAVIGSSFKPMVLEGNLITRLFGHFEAFKPSEKNVMRIALDRLNQALRRQSNVDMAIDLGIALEVMLLHGLGKNDRGEMRFRSSIRGAAFLGGDKPERLSMFKLLRQAYDLRSGAVHSGVLEDEIRGTPTKQILEDAADTCARIARKLIDRGSFPDWDEYVIDGQWATQFPGGPQ